MEGLTLARIARMLVNRSHPADVRDAQAMRDALRERGLGHIQDFVLDREKPVDGKKFIVCPACHGPFVPPNPLGPLADLEGAGKIDGPTLLELVDSLMAGTPCPFCDTIIK